MKPLKMKNRAVVMTGILAGLTGMALAGTLAMADDMGGMGDVNGMSGMSSGTGGSSAASSVGHGKGVVKAVDPKAGTVTIAHGPIKEFGWSGMTMTFPLRHRSSLKSLKKGEHVVFEVTQQGQGQYTITQIHPVH
ncbi:MAG: copper-binding protein [Leptospirillum sp.]